MLVTNCVSMRPLNRLRVFGAHNESRVAHLVWQVLILFSKSSEAILI